MRRIWSPSNFKSAVSPHEFIQAVSYASKKRFRPGVQSEAVDFLSWLLNSLHQVRAWCQHIIHTDGVPVCKWRFCRLLSSLHEVGAWCQHVLRRTSIVAMLSAEVGYSLAWTRPSDSRCRNGGQPFRVLGGRGMLDAGWPKDDRELGRFFCSPRERGVRGEAVVTGDETETVSIDPAFCERAWHTRTAVCRKMACASMSLSRAKQHWLHPAAPPNHRSHRSLSLPLPAFDVCWFWSPSRLLSYPTLTYARTRAPSGVSVAARLACLLP